MLNDPHLRFGGAPAGRPSVGGAAYIPAEELGVSGVLATVAAGLYLGWRNPETTAPRNRLQLFGL
jgi:NhaP-type Na+/H+ or K+/H+ antiporter